MSAYQDELINGPHDDLRRGSKRSVPEQFRLKAWRVSYFLSPICLFKLCDNIDTNLHLAPAQLRWAELFDCI